MMSKLSEALAAMDKMTPLEKANAAIMAEPKEAQG
jgi:hypothetical protein